MYPMASFSCNGAVSPGERLSVPTAAIVAAGPPARRGGVCAFYAPSRSVLK